MDGDPVKVCHSKYRLNDLDGVRPSYGRRGEREQRKEEPRISPLRDSSIEMDTPT